MKKSFDFDSISDAEEVKDRLKNTTGYYMFEDSEVYRDGSEIIIEAEDVSSLEEIVGEAKESCRIDSEYDIVTALNDIMGVFR